MYAILHYRTVDELDVFETWLDSLRDPNAIARVIARIDRMGVGNFGDCKHVGQGVWELRVDQGPGYRVYYALAGREIVLLLCGGDKRRQSRDIRRALDMWNDYKDRRPK